jgi:N-acetylglucosamine malate deacetylase 1
MKIQTVLVLSPHTDDAELGAGATIARFLEEGKDIHFAIFSCCETSIPKGMPAGTLKKECLLSLKNLGIPSNNITIFDYDVRTFPTHRQEILQNLVDIKDTIEPDLVLIPSSHDMHQDHGVIYWEALRTFKKDTTILGYEHPWNNLTFTTDVFVKVNELQVEKKIKALKEYKSQKERGYMKENNLRALIITRGAQLDADYAEAFELIRCIV